MRRAALGKLLLQCTYRTCTELIGLVRLLHPMVVLLPSNSWQGQTGSIGLETGPNIQLGCIDSNKRSHDAPKCGGCSSHNHRGHVACQASNAPVQSYSQRPVDERVSPHCQLSSAWPSERRGVQYLAFSTASDELCVETLQHSRDNFLCFIIV